jgi:hypothetical protein
MSFSLAQVNTVAVGIGAAIWVAAVGAIWLLPRRDPALHREEDFLVWKNLNRKPSASFSEFLASEQAPRAYLSRVELSVAVTAVALLALFFALRHWGAWQ